MFSCCPSYRKYFADTAEATRRSRKVKCVCGHTASQHVIKHPHPLPDRQAVYCAGFQEEETHVAEPLSPRTTYRGKRRVTVETRCSQLVPVRLIRSNNATCQRCWSVMRT